MAWSCVSYEAPPPPAQPFYIPPFRGASALGVSFNQPSQYTLTRVSPSQSGLSVKYLIPSELSLMSTLPAHQASQNVSNDVKIIRPGQVQYPFQLTMVKPV